MALGLFSHLFRRSRGNQSTSVFAAFGPNVDEVVAHFQHVEVVLNPAFVSLGGSFRNAQAAAVQAEAAYREEQ